MTKRDYIKLAGVLADVHARAEAEFEMGADDPPVTYVEAAILAVADVLAADNAAFDRDRFIKAAMVGAVL